MIDDAVRLLGRTAVRLAQGVPVVGARFGAPPRLDLTGRVVFVTGAARGLGCEIARQAHARGARVALVGRRLPPLTELAADLGDGAAAFQADVTDAEALRHAAAGAVARFGGIDVVIANAGIAPPSHTVGTIDPDAFEHTVEVDLLGQWRTVRATMSAVIERRGHIALVGSIYAFFNGVLAAPYAVSKAGVEQLSRTLRVELAQHGVTAGIAYLGFIDTDLAADAFADEQAAAIRDVAPDFITRPMTVEAAAAAVLDGVERRAARVTAPAWVGPLLATRSLFTAVMDDVLIHNRRVNDAIRDAENSVVPREG
ncbi:SDR family NAD(P)-dependent oxidoreductase [Mycolicibacterium sp. S2-37]|uniref:short-chain dehydrogenase/reductase n=1 Tax=Mycolicibacterium sp. S2-37 TaxID=2810297 RepID=UPI001A945D3D|nr:short-chain dehydrogenase/reductase [Mycolicibacterium sp. S2-37]MBO0678625.1 SDR family NAD(P)-dependent oxidoreductase [Mycolicibacterium sp. S2-37]